MVDFTGKSNNGYEFRQVIGSGGFGTVYEAYQPILKRRVAVKVINPQHANQPAFIRNFHVEAELVASLEHPHIVPLYDYWRDANGAFLIMRWLSGGNLRQSIQIQPWDTRQTARLLDQITAALAVAHRHRVVHRDIKPDNILLDEEGNAYLADFGIAKRTDLQTSKDDAGAGTIHYAAPEQFQRKDITAQTDIYSLGVMLYEVLTGQHPFSGATPSEIVYKHLQEPLPDVTQVRQTLPADVQKIIQDMTAKDPSQRYRDVRSVAVDFREALMQRPAASVKTAQTPPATTQSYVDDTPTLVDTSELDNPYKGLRAFTEADVDDFYGRALLTQHLLDRLSEKGSAARFLAVVGPSGSGKSSVVKAGLLPMIRAGELVDSENWFITEMYPGSQPFAELEAALIRVAVNQSADLLDTLRAEHGISRAINQILPADDDSELMLVIDQFEELFTLVADEPSRSRFLDNLLDALNDARSRLRVVVTLRADFYDRPLQYRAFGELMRQRVETVLPLSHDELEVAIRQPAERLGVSFEPGLVQIIINEIGEQPGTLPLLQYALTELFERRDGRLLTLKTYQEIGGVVGALTRRADDLYQESTEAEQDAAHQLFLRLVTLGEGTEDTRRRVRLTEIANLSDAMQAVLDRYGESRLLTFDREMDTRQPTIEIAHEALILKWDRFREWLNDSRVDIQLQRLLATAAADWRRADQDASYLLRGARLAQYEEWSDTMDIVLTPDEQTFLQASFEEDRRQKQLEEDRRQQELTLQQRAANRLRLLAGSLTLFLIVALGLSVFAFDQQRQAVEQAGTATVAQGEALVQAITATNAQGEALNQAATATNAQGEAFNQAGTATVAQGDALNQAATAQAAQFQAERSAAENQSLALAASARNAIFTGQYDTALALALAANDIDNAPQTVQLVLLDAAANSRISQRYVGHSQAVTTMAISPDGSVLASGSQNGELFLWDTARGEKIHELRGHCDILTAMQFTADNKQLLASSQDGILILWDVETGTRVRTLQGNLLCGDTTLNLFVENPISIAINADGTLAITGMSSGRLVLRDLQEHNILAEYQTQAGNFENMIFGTSDETLLASVSTGAIIEWHIERDEIIQEYIGLENREVTGLAISPDERWLMGATLQGRIIIWNLETAAEYRRYDTDIEIEQAILSPDGETIITTSPSGDVVIRDFFTGAIIDQLVGHTNSTVSVATAPDGRQIFSASQDETLIQWDRSVAGEDVTLWEDTEYDWQQLIFSPDAQQGVFFDNGVDTTVLRWSLEDDPQITARSLRFSLGEMVIRSGAYGPAGELIVLVAQSDTSQQRQLFDANLRDIRSTVAGFPVRSVAISPDEQLIALGLENGRLDIDEWTERPESGVTINRTAPRSHTTEITALNFSADGQFIAGGTADNLVLLWELASGHIIQQFEGHTRSVNVVTFSPDGKQILSGADDSLAILWDAESGEPIHRFEGHDATVTGVVFSPDGQYVVTGSDDGTVLLWDVQSGEPLRRYVYDSPVIGVRYAPDSEKLMVGTASGTLHVQDGLPYEGGIETWIAGNRYVPELTCEQRARYSVFPLCGD